MLIVALKFGSRERNMYLAYKINSKYSTVSSLVDKVGDQDKTHH